MIEACPKCGGKKLLRMVFGFPDAETVEAAQRGEIALGGCGLDRFRHFECAQCHWTFFVDGSGLLEPFGYRPSSSSD